MLFRGECGQEWNDEAKVDEPERHPNCRFGYSRLDPLQAVKAAELHRQFAFHSIQGDGGVCFPCVHD